MCQPLDSDDESQKTEHEDCMTLRPVNGYIVIKGVRPFVSSNFKRCIDSDVT